MNISSPWDWGTAHNELVYGYTSLVSLYGGAQVHSDDNHSLPLYTVCMLHLIWKVNHLETHDHLTPYTRGCVCALYVYGTSNESFILETNDHSTPYMRVRVCHYESLFEIHCHNALVNLSSKSTWCTISAHTSTIYTEVDLGRLTAEH